MSGTWYRNQRITKENARVFDPANRCIYCKDGKPPFTREHVIPRGLGGGMVYPKASCEKCRQTIHEVETYCMRGPFPSHRLELGLVNDLADLGDVIKMPIRVDGKRGEKSFSLSDLPNWLVLPQCHSPPGLLSGRNDGTGQFSFTLWGDQRSLDEHGSVEASEVLAEGFDLLKFARAIAKIAHGFVAGEYGLDNFEPWLPPLILGEDTRLGDILIGNWGEDGMERENVLHQIGVSFVEHDATDQHGKFVRVDVRLRLFARYEKTPVYRIIVGVLTKPIDEVLAPHGQRSVPPNA
jgi:HNH endonuclease